MPEIAIIGDEDVIQMFPDNTPLEFTDARTPYGMASWLARATIEGAEVILVQRNRWNLFAGAAAGTYSLPKPNGEPRIPSEVPYRANIYALKRLGVRYIFSVSHSGRLSSAMNVNDIVFPDQFVDMTTSRGAPFFGQNAWAHRSKFHHKFHPDMGGTQYQHMYNLQNNRGDTFFGGGAIAHVSMSQPVCPALGAMLASAARKKVQDMVDRHGTESKPVIHSTGTAGIFEGPALPTFGETSMFKTLGCITANMTDMPEAKLAREAEIAYASIGVITDEDMGVPTYLGDQWNEQMTQRSAIKEVNTQNAKLILMEAVRKCGLMKPQSIAHYALDSGLRTPVSQMSAFTKGRLGWVLNRFGVSEVWNYNQEVPTELQGVDQGYN